MLRLSVGSVHYRALTIGERDQFIALDAQAFNATIDRDLFSDEVVPHLRGLFVGNQRVCQLQHLPLHVMAGSSTVACAGVAGVATPPEHRRKGYTAALLRHFCDEIRSQGTALCMLYPFSHPFYKRYGWATMMERRVYRGAPAKFTDFRYGAGQFVPTGKDAIGEIDQIYSAALRGRFGPLVRDAQWWEQRVLNYRGKKQPHYAYIWRDDTGRGRSYLVYHIERDAHNQRTLTCREIVALDPEARAQLFAFLANHDSQVEHVVFRAPADAPVNLLLPDPLACEVEPHFMLRLVDVAAALAAYTYPTQCAGRVTLAVSDDWLDHNNTTFALEIANGQATCTPAPGAPADLRCDVRVLAQIYSRYLQPRSAAAFGVLGVENRDALTLLNRAFAGLAPFSSDFF